jgi:hypothetical protein
MAMTRIATGVYRDEVGEYHIKEEELLSAPEIGDDGEYGDDSDIDGVDDSFGDDDAAAMRWLMGEVGRTNNPRRKRKLNEKFNRRANRLEKRAAKKGVDLDINDPPEDKVNTGWVSTAVSGSTPTGSGLQSAVIRVQHDFKAEDLRAIGLAGSKVTEIRFGDRSVWSSTTGVDIAFLGASSFLTGILRKQSIRGGLDITITANLPSSGTVEFVITGSKPGTC